MEENKSKKLFKKETIITLLIGLAVGLVLGLIIMFFANGGLAAKVNGKLITKSEVYDKMKDYVSIDLILEDVDTRILDKKYELNEDEINELKERADSYIEQYEAYGYTEEEFLSQNGFANYDDFVEYLKTDYKRTIYFYDYLENKLEENSVETYYNENAFGKVNTKHILVHTSDDMTDEQALAIANEIITRLNAGEEFDALAEEYVANYGQGVIDTEDLGETGAFDSIETSYTDAAKELEIGAYTLTPVETSYGYHVIYCIDKTEKTDEISHADRMSIIQTLIAEQGIETDDTEYYKALIQMREDAKLKFYDKDLKTQYEEYCAESLGSETEE